MLEANSLSRRIPSFTRTCLAWPDMILTTILLYTHVVHQHRDSSARQTHTASWEEVSMPNSKSNHGANPGLANLASAVRNVKLTKTNAEYQTSIAGMWTKVERGIREFEGGSESPVWRLIRDVMSGSSPTVLRRARLVVTQ